MAATLIATHRENPWNTKPGAGPGALFRQAIALSLRRLAWSIEHGGRAEAVAYGLEGANDDYIEAAEPDGAGGGVAETSNSEAPSAGAEEIFDLEAAAAGLAKADAADSTIDKYAGALRRLGAWLAGRPATDALLAEYLGVLYLADCSFAVARQVVAAVVRGAREAGVADGCPAGEETRRRLGRYRRACAEKPRKQVVGVGWEDADRVRDLAAADGNLRGLRDAAMVAVMSDALLRVSEASALDVDDVTFQPDGTALLRIRRSKTDQGGDGAVSYLGAPTARCVAAWLEAADIASGPLFRPVRRGRAGAKRLGADSVREVVKKRAKRAGLKGWISGHSLRVGSAQSMAERGASLVEMQRDGRWGSPDLPAHYARGLSAARGATARLRYRAGGEGAN